MTPRDAVKIVVQRRVVALGRSRGLEQRICHARERGDDNNYRFGAPRGDDDLFDAADRSRRRKRRTAKFQNFHWNNRALGRLIDQRLRLATSVCCARLASAVQRTRDLRLASCDL